jgi:hypothetical protein
VVGIATSLVADVEGHGNDGDEGTSPLELVVTFKRKKESFFTLGGFFIHFAIYFVQCCGVLSWAQLHYLSAEDCKVKILRWHQLVGIKRNTMIHDVKNACPSCCLQ